MNDFTRLCAVLALVSVIQVSEQQEFISPCPEVFRYDQEGLTWVGRIELPTTNIENDLNLEVVLSLKRPLPSAFQGFIALKDDLLTVFQNIINGRKITYIVNFPLKVEIPSVVSIKFNGQNYCEGVKPKKYATIIRLEHKSQLRSTDEATTRKSSTARAPTRKKKPTSRRPSTPQGTSWQPDTQGTSKRPVTTVSPYQDLDDMYSGIFENMGQKTNMRPTKGPAIHRTSKRSIITVSTHDDLDDMYSGVLENMGQKTNMRPTKGPAIHRTSNRPIITVSTHDDLDDMYSGIFKNMGQGNIMRPNKRPILQRTSSRPVTTVSPHFDLDDMYSGIFKNMEQEKVRPNKQRQHEKQNKHSELSEERDQKEPSTDMEYYDENDPVKPNGPRQSEEDETFADERNSEKLKGSLDIRMNL